LATCQRAKHLKASKKWIMKDEELINGLNDMNDRTKDLTLSGQKTLTGWKKY
jgi:hypothetical protein